MKKHVWRPLFVVLGVVATILLFRLMYVPTDFGVQERGYTFGFYRLGNEQEWKKLPPRYKGSEYCGGCHHSNTNSLAASRHATIPCENCHGPALDHPEKPVKLAIDRSQALCLRCHSELFMPSSGRQAIPGIDPARHNTDSPCVDCHNPHDPNLEAMQ